MQLALRPYATAGVALVGASVIAVSPVAAPPTIDVRDASVELSALANPIEQFAPIFETALENAQAVVQRIADNPAPILTQIIANQVNGIGNIGDALQAQIGVLPHLPQLLRQSLASEVENLGTLGGLSQEFLQNVLNTVTGGALQDQIQLAIDTARGGDFGGAFSDLAAVPLLLIAGEGLENLILLPEFITALQQPLADVARLFPIAAGPLTNGQAVIAAIPNAALALGLGALTPVIGAANAAGETIDGLIEAAQTRNPELVFNTLITQAAAVTSSVLGGALDPSFGIAAGIEGLRESIAAAVTTPSFPPAQAVAAATKAPGTTTQSFTLTAPPPKTAEPKALKASDNQVATSGSVDSPPQPTAPTDTAPPSTTNSNAKGGNLFTPGATPTKGGRHRADTGGFGQSLRDAAEKTIKGITGLGRDKKSESPSASTKSGESGSSSAGSGSVGGGATK